MSSPSQKSTKSLINDSIVEIENGLDFEWIPHSTSIALSYLAIAISSILYYSSCFIYEYGKYSHRVTHDWLAESYLLRVVIVQWFVIATLLFTGALFYRRILMPLYIFLAVIATNGTMVLFIIKFKQFIDQKIDLLDISFNLVTLLLISAIFHNIVYFYALHVHLNNRKIKRQFLRV